ncbi:MULTISPECIES: DapH/DapD/GlmU-related protein [Paenibacillus]|uniref:DapH/DapD/GlmU-related protein n=1 Tax=Paenibacillus TaxID=44249 RepID=UPI0022B89156|nr:DapH/DapD/GlmU-related protein [Paenibacillus caseinilyticus]MCZ8523498.1 DapH/DapD/GlmU-related protein [Paenibacillus caseinilyticus]
MSIIRKVAARTKGYLSFGGGHGGLAEMPRIRGKVYVNRTGELRIGKGLSIIAKPWAVQLTVVKGAKLTIGDNVLINAGVGIASNLEVSIGNHVKIGPRTSIFDSQYHPLDSRDTGDMCRPVRIGDNVWIGTGCLILPGVSIGRNSVVAAGSTVTRDVPENVVVGGVPARIIKELHMEPGWIRS